MLTEDRIFLVIQILFRGREFAYKAKAHRGQNIDASVALKILKEASSKTIGEDEIKLDEIECNTAVLTEEDFSISTLPAIKIHSNLNLAPSFINY